MPDLRGHGISEGEYATMGYYDSVDIIEWIYEIIKKILRHVLYCMEYQWGQQQL